MAELSYAELPDVQQPPSRPKGVTARQWRLAALYPRCKTSVEALIQAGYARATATGVAKRTFDSAGVQRAIATQTQAKLDSARSINGIVAGKLRSRIEDDSASDQLILGAYKVTTDALVAGADDVESIGEHERIEAREYIKTIINALLVATRADITMGNFDVITPQLIDSIVDRAERGELTQYQLSDASPHSPTLQLPESSATSSVNATVVQPAKRGPGRPRKQA